MIDLLRRAFRRPARKPETDVPLDPGTANARETGGDAAAHPEGAGDSAATTGTGASGSFVGRVSGPDAGGDEGESGAERRARG